MNRERDRAFIWERIAENFPNREKKTETRAQETQTVPNKMNLKRSTPRYN